MDNLVLKNDKKQESLKSVELSETNLSKKIVKVATEPFSDEKEMCNFSISMIQEVWK